MGAVSIDDTRVDVASEWIIQGGRRLLRKLLLNFMLTLWRMRSMAAPTEEVLYIPGQEGSIMSDWTSRTAN
jgi:hypothetical protein